MATLSIPEYNYTSKKRFCNLRRAFKRANDKRPSLFERGISLHQLANHNQLYMTTIKMRSKFTTKLGLKPRPEAAFIKLCVG